MHPANVYSVALVVHPNADTRATVVRTLRDAGFQTTGVAGFEAARQLLASEPVDVLVTEARLGDFHGLHLVLLARTANPAAFAAVIAAAHDTVLQRDVEGAGATLFVGDGSEAVAALISRWMTAGTPDRALH